jgi:carbonic anhydrase
MRLALILLFWVGTAQAATHAAPGVTPAQAWQRLQDGNQRYATGAAKHPHQSATYRRDNASGQHPIAVVVGCSDSRVSPEIAFDQGIGDLFVVRTAGNRLDDLVLASIEYAVEHLGTGLVVVVGHERCGAVSAAVEAAKPSNEHEAASHVPILVKTLSDAVTATAGKPGDPVENAVQENVRIVVRGISAESPYLAERIKSGALKVVGARYDLDTGRVSVVE